MTNDEAKFILRSFRADGSDAADPIFAAALRRAEHDPALRAWLEHERAIEQSLRRKLVEADFSSRSPAEIIVCVQGRLQRQHTWRTVGWVTGATFAVLFAVAATLQMYPSQPDVHQLIRFALADAPPSKRSHLGMPEVVGRLASFPGPGGLRAAMAALPELSVLKADNCRTLVVAGQEVLEFCFGPNHSFHIYLAPRGAFSTDGLRSTPLFFEQDQFAAATWADERHVYTVVTGAGADALRALL